MTVKGKVMLLVTYYSLSVLSNTPKESYVSLKQKTLKYYIFSSLQGSSAVATLL